MWPQLIIPLLLCAILRKKPRIKSKSSIGGKLTGPQLPPTSTTKSRESKEQKNKKKRLKENLLKHKRKPGGNAN
jgi:hypothetical protein